ncbi:hypothetical protein F66182_10459 [Fusarium sp. NRRL 66182]|nr:hypothetical protein F66182_10459 [Fusarium sp. NRRL 66182]
MFTPLVFILVFGRAQGGVAEDLAKPATPLFVKDGTKDGFKPYQAFNYPGWVPEPSFYEGLAMVEKTVEVDGQKLVYQDFNVSALGLEDFKAHFMGAEQFYDAKGKFMPSDEEAKAYHASLIAHEEDPDAELVLPNHLQKKACRYTGDRCTPTCTNFVSRGVRQTANTDVYGAYHYVSEPLCGTGSISKSVPITHVSGITLGGYAQIPGFGKGWVKAVSTFFSTFGFFPSKGADTLTVHLSMTTSVAYSSNCGPFNVCFLWERPHFTVDKGVVITQFIDVGSKRSCKRPQITPYEAHIMHNVNDPGGALSHGACYSMKNHGCGRRIQASSTLQRCPNQY